ncbi:MAG: helix-turn-helix domain-containing protein, partial [Bacteroidales bacterium]
SIGVLSLLLFLYLQKKKLKRSYQNLFLKNQELIESEKRGRYSSSSLNNTQKDSLIENICKLMENSVLFLDPNFSLEILSEELQSNSKYVSQVINEHFHKNFTTFVNEYRVKEACKLFADDAYKNLTIEAIAEKVGFKNRTSFNPVFKKYTGITPSQYMNMCLNS